MGRVKATSRLGSPRNANTNSLFCNTHAQPIGQPAGRSWKELFFSLVATHRLKGTGAGIPHIGVKTIMSMHVAART